MVVDLSTLTTAPPLSAQRADIGLKTPSWEDKELIWSRVTVPSADIFDGYKPMSGAKKAHQADARGVGVSGGWRAGKSLLSGMEAVAWLPYANLIWLVGVDYDMSRQEFLYLSEAAVSSGLAQPGSVRFPDSKYTPCTLRAVTGCVVETRTLSDFRKLAGKPPDLVIVCEPGLIDNLNLVMELLWGRVSQNRGCILLAGTSDEASEEWYELWARWSEENVEGGKSFSMPTWQNRHKFPAGRKEREFAVYQEAYGEESFLAHFGGVPASPRNLVLRGYWSRDINVVEDLAFDPTLQVEIAVDPNYSLGHRYTVEVIQWDEETGKMFLVDEIAEEGLTHEEIIDIAKTRPWWPHVFGGVIDPFAGESHVYGSRAPNWYWKMKELRTDHRPQVNTTVQALKQALHVGGDGHSRLAVSSNCPRFAYEAPRWRQNKTGKPQDGNCDALKATGYWLVDRFADEMVPGGGEETNAVKYTDYVVD